MKTDYSLFNYKVDYEGLTYVIRTLYSVDYSYKQPDFSTWDSDWDYKGGFEHFEVDMEHVLVCNAPVDQEGLVFFTSMKFDDLPWFVKESFMEDLEYHALQQLKEGLGI